MLAGEGLIVLIRANRSVADDRLGVELAVRAGISEQLQLLPGDLAVPLIGLVNDAIGVADRGDPPQRGRRRVVRIRIAGRVKLQSHIVPGSQMKSRVIDHDISSEVGPLDLHLAIVDLVEMHAAASLPAGGQNTFGFIGIGKPRLSRAAERRRVVEPREIQVLRRHR